MIKENLRDVRKKGGTFRKNQKLARKPMVPVSMKNPKEKRSLKN
jgi:hypothetical protein